MRSAAAGAAVIVDPAGRRCANSAPAAGPREIAPDSAGPRETSSRQPPVSPPAETRPVPGSDPSPGEPRGPPPRPAPGPKRAPGPSPLTAPGGRPTPPSPPTAPVPPGSRPRAPSPPTTPAPPAVPGSRPRTPSPPALPPPPALPGSRPTVPSPPTAPGTREPPPTAGPGTPNRPVLPEPDRSGSGSTGPSCVAAPPPGAPALAPPAPPSPPTPASATAAPRSARGGTASGPDRGAGEWGRPAASARRPEPGRASGRTDAACGGHGRPASELRRDAAQARGDRAARRTDGRSDPARGRADRRGWQAAHARRSAGRHPGVGRRRDARRSDRREGVDGPAGLLLVGAQRRDRRGVVGAVLLCGGEVVGREVAEEDPGIGGGDRGDRAGRVVPPPRPRVVIVDLAAQGLEGLPVSLDGLSGRRVVGARSLAPVGRALKGGARVGGGLAGPFDPEVAHRGPDLGIRVGVERRRACHELPGGLDRRQPRRVLEPGELLFERGAQVGVVVVADLGHTGQAISKV